MMLVILISLMIGTATLSPSSPEEIQNRIFKPDALQSGEIKGIKYSYGQRQFESSGNITYTDQGIIEEISNVTETGVRNMDLIKSIEVLDFYYFLSIFESNSTANITIEEWYNNATYQALLTEINSTIPFNWDTDYNTGLGMMRLNFTEDYDTYTASVVTEKGDFVGQFPVNVTHIEFLNMDPGTGEISYISIVTVPFAIVVNLVTEIQQVFFKRSQVSFGYMGYFNRYSMAYNVSATAYQVNITDGENFGVGVTMFDRIDAEYLEVGISVLSYSFWAADVTTLEFSEDGMTGNGTKVEDRGFIYPLNLMPVSASATGTIIQAGFRHISSSLVSTYQSVVAGFVATSQAATDDSFNATLNIGIWGLSTSTTMIAFNDGNENGKLDLGVNNDGLFVDPQDQVEAIGLAEAYEINVTNAYYTSNVYNESVNYWGLGYSYNATNVNRTELRFDFASYGFGDIDATTTSTFNWVEPTTTTSGDVVFNFGVDYTNFPVTWINMTDGSAAVDYENIGYTYTVVVNPETGAARISPTWIYGGIADPTMKDKAKDLSLALLVTSEFFGLTATYTASVNNDTVNATSTRTFTNLRVGFGGRDVTEVDVTGTKAKYQSNGVTYDAKFDAIRLVTASGTFEGERVSPFSSESENTGGAASTGSLVETLTVNVFYTASLIVISYPTWNGNNIIHDPDYNISYQKVNRASTGTDTGTDTGSPKDTGTTDTSPVPTSDKPKVDAPKDTKAPTLPGFGVVTTLLGIFALLPIIRRKFKG